MRETLSLLRALGLLLGALLYVFVAVLLLAAAMPAHAAPACWPAEVPGASGTRAVYRQDATHRAVVWGCTDGFRSWAEGFAGPRSAFAADWLAQAHALLWATDADRAAAWQRLITAPPVKRGAIPAHDAALAALVLPPVPSYVVARNGVYPTRPAYPFVEGARLRTESARATVGAPCDCSVRSVEGSNAYCGIAAGQVALCTRVP